MARAKKPGRAGSVPKRRRETFEEFYSTFLKTISNDYPHDKCRPGIVTSYLARDGKHYASVARYIEDQGQGKIVVVTRLHESFEQAIRLLAKDYLGLGKAKSQLAAMVEDGDPWEGLADIGRR